MSRPWQGELPHFGNRAQDLLVDPIQHSSQCFRCMERLQRPLDHGNIFKRYRDIELVILWKSILRHPLVRDERHLVAVFQGGVIQGQNGDLGTRWDIYRDPCGHGIREVDVVPLVDSRYDDSGSSVLALGVDRPQELEGVGVLFSLGHVVWLDRSQYVENLRVIQHRNPSVPPGVFTPKDIDARHSFFCGRTFDDGKGTEGVGSLALPERKLPREVIERPVQAIEDIADDVRDGCRWWITEMGSDPIALRAGIIFDERDIWLKYDIVGNCHLQNLQLSLGPIELGLNVNEAFGGNQGSIVSGSAHVLTLEDDAKERQDTRDAEGQDDPGADSGRGLA